MNTIKDVATRAGVSIATVSNYINKTRNVRKATGEKIQEAIDALNFQPNTLAKNLKSSEVKEIGVVLPSLDDPYYALILKGIESELSEHGYDINVSFTEELIDKEQEIINNMLSKSKAGLLLVTCQPNNESFFRKKLGSTDIPYVLIDRRIKNMDSNLISFDNYTTIKYLVLQMIARNKKNICLVTGPKDYYSESECVKGYTRAFKEAGIPFDESLIVETDLSKEDAFKNMINLMSHRDVDVVISSTTLTAKGALEAAYIRNTSNLSDLEVICLGEEIWNRYSNLIGIKSTMRTPFNMGTEAAKLLIKNISKPILFEKKTILLPDRITDRRNSIHYNDNLMILDKSVQMVDRKLNILMLKGPGDKPIEGLLPNFTSNTGIDVNITALEQGDLYQEILEDAKREIPKYDVYMYDQPWLNHLVHHDILLDVTKYKREYGIVEDEYLPGIFKSFCQYKTKTFGLPFIYGPQLLFYRKDLFDNIDLKRQFKKEFGIDLIVPKTWSEFNAVSKFFTKSFNPSSPTEFGTTISNDSPYRLSPEFFMRLWSFDSRSKDSEIEFNLRTDAFEKALLNLTEVFDYTNCRNESVSIEKSVKQFSDGDTAMIVSYATYIPEITNRFTSNVVGKVGYTHVPGGKPVLSGWSLGVAQSTPHAENAFRFMNWACGKDISEYFTILKGQSPMLRVYNNDDLLKMYPWLTLLKDTHKYCKARKYALNDDPSKPSQLEIEQHLFIELTKYLQGHKNTKGNTHEVYQKLKRFN